MPDGFANAQSAIETAASSLGGISQECGTVLYSGLDTLRCGNFYLMGYNPGGSDDVQGTIGASLESLNVTGNAWVRENWGRNNIPSQLQKRVHAVFRELGADLDKTLSTNAIFVRSNDAGRLDNPWALWWDHCWPVHQVFLRLVRPKVIVCLGNPSTLELLRTPVKAIGARYKRVWSDADHAEMPAGVDWIESVSIDLGEGSRHSCAILALPHPSPRVHRGWNSTEPSPEALVAIKCAKQLVEAS